MNEFEAGRKAEEFFRRYRGHLVNTMHVGMTRTEGNVGGSDVHSLGASNFVDSGMNDGRTELKAQQSFFCKTEVKAIRNKTFLSRDNNSEEPTGTVEFEMWSNVYSERGRVPREEWTHGWMHGYIHPEEHTEELRRRNVNAIYTRPSELVFIHYEDADADKPYAAIAFDNFDILLERLKELSPWSLDPWEVSFQGCRRFCPLPGEKRTYLLDNMWHVPLRYLEDLATVTLINEEPHITSGLERKRFDHLKSLATDRHFKFRHLDTAIEDKTVEDIRRKTGADTHFTVIPHFVTG